MVAFRNSAANREGKTSMTTLPDQSEVHMQLVQVPVSINKVKSSSRHCFDNILTINTQM